MSDLRRLRAIWLKVQDRLSDDDRGRLHFLLAGDVPRPIADDTTLMGSLRLLEKLFDQDKINDENCNLLIDSLTDIRCFDAANTLRNYQHPMVFNGLSGATMSLAAIMPPLATSEEPSPFKALFHDNSEEDKVPTNHFIVNEIIQTMNNGNHNIIDSNNININQTNINSNNQIRSPRNGFSSLSPKASKMLMLIFLVISCVLATLLILMSKGITESTKVRTLKENEYVQMIKALNGSVMEKNRTIAELKAQVEKLKKAQTTDLSKAGNRFGGDGGIHFDDSESFCSKSSSYLSGIRCSRDLNNAEACQFMYASFRGNHPEKYSSVHGNNGNELNSSEMFHLDNDERIVRVEVKTAEKEVFLGNDRTHIYMPNTIQGLRFFTTKGRIIPPNSDLGESVDVEHYPGYVLGYATGKAGLYIDQLHFFWVPDN